METGNTVEVDAVNTPAESTAAQTAVGQIPAAAPHFSVQGQQPAPGETVASVETPSPHVLKV